MELGEIGNPGAADHGKPLDGVRVLAAEQMQALPFATQLMARLGADVVKVELPGTGESGRGAPPAKALRVASTPMVVVSSSNEATERCPRPAVISATAPIGFTTGGPSAGRL